jgi:16S rRNA (guanine966-N2)-methyltransferase
MRTRLRVIAGEAGGLLLEAPGGARPTTDRVREALFASLGARVPGASVLDLYAGSGALAIEALSRGAERAVLVDRDSEAVAVCRRNLASTHLDSRGRVVATPVQAFVGKAPPPEAPFDLVCCDPPYDTGDTEIIAVLEALATPGWMAPEGVVTVERPKRAEVVAPSWSVAWQRKYGDTLVVLLTLSDQPE